jgi:uncharacterized repeat protein (TIGR03803 family)
VDQVATVWGVAPFSELMPSNGSWTYNVLYTFTGGSDGSWPNGGLVFDAAGNLYGTTSQGGIPDPDHICQPSGCGTVFELKPSSAGWTQAVIHAFQHNGADGISPEGSLVVDEGGNVYGMTNQGGSNGYGTIFELSPSNDLE